VSVSNSKRPATFFDAETRVVAIDTSLLALSEDTLLDSDHDTAELDGVDTVDIDAPPRQTAGPDRRTLRVGAADLRLAIGSEAGTNKLDLSAYRIGKRPQHKPVSLSREMTAMAPKTRLAHGSCPPSFEEHKTSYYTRTPDGAHSRDFEGEETRAVDRTPVSSRAPEPTMLNPIERVPRSKQPTPVPVSYERFEAAPQAERTELRPTTMPAGPYCAVNAPELAEYQITREIASGGMGIVYEAFHRSSNKRVAVKYMREVSAMQAKLVKRFLGEGIAASRIDHPGVAEVYDYGHDNDGVPYLVMEYLEGENLGDRLKRGSLSDHEFLAIAQQLVDILAASHDHGIVHRDLKPDNIFLVEGDLIHVNLLDFGVAKFLDDQHLLNATSEGQVLGTPYYMSPEQCVGTTVDARSDIYSLGCVFYQMLAGKVPFPGNIFDVIIGHRQNQPLPLTSLRAHLPPALTQLINAMMAKSADDRPGDMDSLAVSLASIASGNHGPVPLASSKSTRRSPQTRGQKRRQTHARFHSKETPRRSRLLPLTFAATALVAAAILSTLAIV